MANFLLVAGAWLGGWAWDEVAPPLRAAGHTVHPLTLSGLAERRELPADLRTHVEDVLTEADRLAPDDVVLVGHSYSGIPVGQAAERLGDRLARLVLVDANVPHDGRSMAQGWNPEAWARAEASIAAHGGYWQPLAPADFAGQDLTDEQIARLVARATPQPAATITDPAVLTRPLSDLPTTYIRCSTDGSPPRPDVAELLAEAGERWRLVHLRTGHWPMFSRPAELAALLLEAAED